MIALAPRTRDGCVNINDLRAVILQWGQCQVGVMCADTDGNCTVDINDLRAVNLAWGTCPDCPSQSEEHGPESVEELIELMLEIAAQQPALESNVADAIAALLED